jgi:hypothetical protein
MIGLTSLLSKSPSTSISIDENRGRKVLAAIDTLLQWEDRLERDRETKFVELGQQLCEVRARQFWRLESLPSFDAYLQTRFPDSRRKAYYLMSIHEHLPATAKLAAVELGWTKAAALASVARHDGPALDAEEWIEKAQRLSKQQFREEVDRHISGGNPQPTEIFCFKVFRSQTPVLEQALETAARMIGSDRSRAYCFELICADFLAGVAAAENHPQLLMDSLLRTFQLLQPQQQMEFLRRLRTCVDTGIEQNIASSAE